MNENQKHITVLLHEAVKGLNLQPHGIYIDGTFGRGGHSRYILSQLDQTGRLIAIDRDPLAINEAKTIHDKRFSIIHGQFSQLAEYVETLGLVGKIDGVLLDLGVSSPQLDDPERGFSFMREGPLDMRMDPTQGVPASEWLKNADEETISQVLKEFGEERFAKRVARAIVERNKILPLETTKQLADLVASALPIKEKHKHPATRTFQAIRIQVNGELDEISQGLNAALSVLAPEGRLSVISFHSLEDRIVKNFIRQWSQGPKLPPGLPLTEEQCRHYGKKRLKSMGKLKPSEHEVNENPRSRSSVLRIAEKVDE